MLSAKKAVKIYIFVFGIIFISYFFLFSFTVLFILKMNENISIKKAIEIQIKENALYATITKENNMAYMLELARIRQPEIVAIGSSRVMQFKKEMFSKSFITTGGATNNMKSGRVLLENILKTYKPQKIIIGLDIWWFNPNFTVDKDIVDDINDEIYPISHYVDIIYKYLFEGKIKLSEVIFPKHYKNDVINIKTIGYGAYKNGSGTMNDGSHFYGAMYFGKGKFHDEKFSDTLGRIKNKNKRFEEGDKLDEDSLNELNKIIEICNKNNIELILFFPPFSQIAYNEIQKYPKEYKYIENLKDYLNKNNIKYYDYSNPSVISSSDCEFIDGFHGGDVTYARIAKAILPNDVIKNINELINKNQNHTLTKFQVENFNYKEVDFLNIGCKK